MKEHKNKKKNTGDTNIFDFLMALGSGLVNLLQLERIAGLVVVYLLIRDIYFTINIDKGNEYSKNVLNARELVNLILNSDDSKTVFIVIIIMLIVIIVVLVIIIRTVYVKEIDRLVNERQRLMHDISSGHYEPLKNHNSSERKR